jgi:conjugative transfer signal peptidase TraF
MRRSGWIISTCASVLVFSATASFRPAPMAVWNATASTPIGLYLVRPANDLRVADLVSVKPPEPVASFLADGGYLPTGVPLLKHVLAIAGQIVCRFEHMILVDGVVMGEAREHDSQDRALPVWTGCRTLRPDEIFLMNPMVPDSLDGRYFGPLPVNSVIGRAVPLWTRDDSGNGLIWRMPEH